jgi:putative ABC transport system permease protein
MAKVALRNLWSRKLRTFLTALAIVLGVMMVAGTYVLTDTIDRSFDDIFTETNASVDAAVSSKEAIESQDEDPPPIDEDLLAEVEQTDGVAEAAGGIFSSGVSVIGEDGKPLGQGGAPTFGASALPEPFNPLEYEEGEPPAAADEVVLDKASAENAGYELGDQVPVVGKGPVEEYTLVGIATLGDVESFGGTTTAFFTLDEAQRIAGKEGELDEISAAAEQGTSPTQLAQNLSASLPSDVDVLTGDENAQSEKSDVEEFVGFLETALLIFAAVALFVAAFLIFNTFSITVAQRTREFAMLRTLGAARRQLIGSVVLEAFAIGLAASILGLLAGLGFAPAVRALFEAAGIDLPSTGTVIAARTIIVALVIGTVLAVLSALIPAVRSTRIPPVAGLREGAVIDTPRTHRLRSAAAVALTAIGVALMLLGLFETLSPGEAWVGGGAACMFLGVASLSPRLVRPLASLVGKPLERVRGISGRLARENSVRNPGRTATTAAALMIGLALVSFVTVFAAGLRGSIDDAIDQTLVGDLTLSNTDGFSDIPARSAGAVGEVEGVAAASPSRFVEVAVDGADEGFVTLVDPRTAGDVLELDTQEGPSEVLQGLAPDEATVDEMWAEDNGLAVGDTFEATTLSGRTIDYTVAGTFEDNADFYGDYVASDAQAAAYNEDDSVTNVFVGLDEGVDSNAVRAEIEEVVDTQFPTVQVQNQEELKDSIGEQLNALLGIVYALLALAVIVSLFGIVNTLALSIHERTRELGLLRAVGMSRRQVRRVVRYESVITALIGGVLGTLLGVVFAVLVSRPLADEGFTLSIPVGTLLVLLLLAVVAGVVAAIGPARRASRLDVLEALAYE